MSNPTPTPNDLVDLKTAARLLDLSERTVWTRARHGDLPSVRVGRARLYSRAALRAWQTAQRRPA